MKEISWAKFNELTAQYLDAHHKKEDAKEQLEEYLKLYGHKSKDPKIERELESTAYRVMWRNVEETSIDSEKVYEILKIEKKEDLFKTLAEVSKKRLDQAIELNQLDRKVIKPAVTVEIVRRFKAEEIKQ